MAKAYATLEALQALEVPTRDVEVDGLLFRLAALRRSELKRALDTVGYKTNAEGEEVPKDAEEADILLLATSVVEPPLDPENPDHLALLRSMSIGSLKKLTDAMMVLSGMRKEDPTNPTGG